MLTYNGASYTWMGRELRKITNGSNTYSYKYNADGIRTSKTVNGTTTEFFLNGSQILAQKTGDSVMRFIYDSTGKRVGFANGTMLFYYLYNVQGDVIAIVRAATGQIVAKYSYDAWGNCTVTNAAGYAVGDKNPFRYRGYYYDTETGLYYLNSRYYNPEFGRFISADRFASTDVTMPLSANAYSYCENNPIARKDVDGALWVSALIGVASVYVADIIGNVIEEKSGWDILKPTSSVGTYLGAGVSGMITGGGLISVISRPIVNTGIKYGIDCGIGNKDFSIKGVATDLTMDYIGEALSVGVSKALNATRPQNYSSFRHQMTRRIPKITQEQTRQLMKTVNRAISAVIDFFEFTLNTITNMQG